MKRKDGEKRASAVALPRFLLGYGLLVSLLIWLLPMAGRFLEHQYDAMTGISKILTVLGLLTAIGAWQWLNWRGHARVSESGERER